jgi:hypothetical protein
MPRASTRRSQSHRLAWPPTSDSCTPWFSFFQVERRSDPGTHAESSWGFRFGINLPIFKWNDEPLRAARADMERCQFEYASAESRIRLEIEELTTQLRAATQTWTVPDKRLRRSRRLTSLWSGKPWQWARQTGSST